MQNDPTEDGINYSGIAFPTPLKDFDKLEAQNQNVAIKVFFFLWLEGKSDRVQGKWKTKWGYSNKFKGDRI